MMKPETDAKVRDARSALKALYLNVERSIAEDIEQRVLQAIDALVDEVTVHRVDC
jgi:hypothetical protein